MDRADVVRTTTMVGIQAVTGVTDGGTTAPMTTAPARSAPGSRAHEAPDPDTHPLTPRSIDAERAALEAQITGRTLCPELARTAARHGDLAALTWEDGGKRRALSFRVSRPGSRGWRCDFGVHR